MSRFATQFDRSGMPKLVRQFGEPVTYRPAAGGTRSIDAMVERRSVEIMAELGEVSSNTMIVRVENDATNGITTAEIDTGGDLLDVPLRSGETAVTLAIVQLLNSHGGVTRFVVQ